MRDVSPKAWFLREVFFAFPSGGLSESITNFPPKWGDRGACSETDSIYVSTARAAASSVLWVDHTKVSKCEGAPPGQRSKTPTPKPNTSRICGELPGDSGSDKGAASGDANKCCARFLGCALVRTNPPPAAGHSRDDGRRFGRALIGRERVRSSAKRACRHDRGARSSLDARHALLHTAGAKLRHRGGRFSRVHAPDQGHAEKH